MTPALRVNREVQIIWTTLHCLQRQSGNLQAVPELPVSVFLKISNSGSSLRRLPKKIWV